MITWGTPAARWLLTATVLGSGLAQLDATVVNVALSRIGTDLDAGFDGLQWILNGYTLPLAGLILLGGSLGDRFGRRRVFMIGVAWFAVASLFCGLAQDIPQLVLARALQGVGGALLTPGSLALISASFDAEDRGRAIGAWAGLSGVASAIGPFLGGWLLQIASWRAVFLINLPVAALVLWVSARHVPESSDPLAAPRLDWAGTALAVLGLTATTYALIQAGEGLSPAVFGLGLAGIAALVGFVLLERVSDHPLVPLEMFRSMPFTVANLFTFVVYGSMGAVFFLLVLDLQEVAGFGPVAAGAALLPITVLMLLFSARVGSLADRIGPRWPMAVGALLAAGGLLLMLRIGPDASYLADVLPGAVVFGLGLTALVAPLTATVLSAAPTRHAGVASGVNNAVARAGGLFAVAALPALAGLSSADYRSAPALDAGFRTVLLICAALMVLGALAAAVGLRGQRTRR